MTPEESFRLPTDEGKRLVHLRLCGEALTVWDAYVLGRGPIRYVDGVVGMRHEVDVRLPHDAMESARAGRDLADVASRYREPIVAMQDDDLEFPRQIEFAYYAVYNCFRRYAGGEEVDGWVIVNQALAGVDGEGATWSRRLTEAVGEGAEGRVE